MNNQKMMGLLTGLKEGGYLNEAGFLMAYNILEKEEDDWKVSSIDDAIALLKTNHTPQDRRELVKYIVNPDNDVTGDPDIFYNFLMSLFDYGDYKLAIPVCDYVLRFSPYNSSIIGAAMRACGFCEEFEKGEEYLQLAEKSPYEKWNEYLFFGYVDFLQKKSKAFPMDNELLDRALKVADKFIDQFKFNERAYERKAELLLEANREKEAIDVLRNAIFSYIDTEGKKLRVSAAQCCVTLIGILQDRSDYDEIISICDEGLRSATKTQSSVNIGYFVYCKALALDAKAHKDKFKQGDLIEDAMKFYQSAYDLVYSDEYRRVIEQRYAVLRPHAGKQFVPLEERDLIEDKRQKGAI